MGPVRFRSHMVWRKGWSLMKNRKGKGKTPKTRPVCPVCQIAHGDAGNLACAVRVGVGESK